MGARGEQARIGQRDAGDLKKKMEIKDEHKVLLKTLGLKEEDFDRFDGKFVRYEYDDVKGVRIYDPYCATSYSEYIGIDGWSAWSTEQDTFMSDILKGARDKARQSEGKGPRPEKGEIEEALRRKFENKSKIDPE